MKGRIFVSLFALPFFGVGVWMLWSIATTIGSAWQMGDWAAVDATVTNGGYETHTGDDSETYEAYADYRYSYDGRQYRGDRVGLASGGDNIGSYQEDMGRWLQRAQSTGSSITVYVDPENPDAAIIDRSIRWGLVGFKSLFLVIFGGVGLGLLIAAWRAPKEKDKSLEVYAESPWLLNDNWQTPAIKSDSKSAMYGAWFFTALWNLVSAPLPFVLYEEITEKQNYPALLGLLFPLIGIGLLVWAIRRTREWTSFGPAPVNLDPFPGSIGGHVGGSIELNVPFNTANEFNLTLTCAHSYESGSGKNRSRREKATWQKKLIAHAEPGSRGTRLTFRFDVPDGLQPADTQKDDSYYLWRLNVNAELPGTDLDRDYELPVFATGQRSRFLSQMAVEKSVNKQRAADERAVRQVVNLVRTPTGKRMFFPMGRLLGPSLTGLVIGAIFAASGGFLIFHEDQVIFGSIFGGVGALIALACLYALTNSLEVVQSGSEVQTIRRVLGIPVRRRSLQRDAFARFEKGSSLKTQSGNKHVVYYSIEAVDRQGNKLVLGEGFRGENEADVAIELIGDEFGLVNAANDGRSAGEGVFGADILA